MWHVWGNGEVHTGFWWGDLRVRDHLEDIGVDWRIILKLSLENWDGFHGLYCSGSGQEQVTGACKRSNETIGYHKMRRIS
jgi:hypothetical protein